MLYSWLGWFVARGWIADGASFFTDLHRYLSDHTSSSCYTLNNILTGYITN